MSPTVNPITTSKRKKDSAILKKAETPKPNLNVDEKRAIKSLRSNDAIILLSADKDNDAVIFYEENYKYSIY